MWLSLEEKQSVWKMTKTFQNGTEIGYGRKLKNKLCECFLPPNYWVLGWGKKHEGGIFWATNRVAVYCTRSFTLLFQIKYFLINIFELCLIRIPWVFYETFTFTKQFSKLREPLQLNCKWVDSENQPSEQIIIFSLFFSMNQLIQFMNLIDVLIEFNLLIIHA